MSEGIRAARSGKVVPSVANVFKKTDEKVRARSKDLRQSQQKKRQDIPRENLLTLHSERGDSEVSSLSRGYSFSKYSQLVMTEGDQKADENNVLDDSLDDDNHEGSGMEDVKATNTLFSKLRDADLVCSVLTTIGFAAGTISTEMEFQRFSNHDLDMEPSIIKFLLIINSISTIALILSLFFRKMIYADWKREKSMLKMGPIKWRTALGLIPELIFVTPHPNIFCYGEVYTNYNKPTTTRVEYELNAVFHSFQLFFRLYIPFRALIMFSAYSNGRSQRVCSINGAESNFHFVVKSLMKERPSLPLMISFITSILLCSYTMLIFERPLGSSRGQDFGDLRNATWCVILTMTSVGYGDYFPVTDEGRLIGTVSAILGFMLLSLMFVTLNNLLEFEISERKAFTFLYRLGEKKKLRKVAARVICLAYYSRKVRRIYTEESQLYKEAFNQFRKRMFEFKILSRRIRGLYISTEEIDILEREIDMMHDKFYDLERDMKVIKSDHLSMNAKMDTFLDLLRSRIEELPPQESQTTDVVTEVERSEDPNPNFSTDLLFEQEEEN